MGIVIRKPGALMTVQDLGRTGYQGMGVSPAGVMDQRSAAAANLLVGNPENEAVLELALGGAELLFEKEKTVAFCGAQVPVFLNGKQMEAGRAFLVPAGGVLSAGYAGRGVYVYLAFAGGLDIPLVMGSRSTHMKTGEGGLDGRKLQAGDRIGFREPDAHAAERQPANMPPKATAAEQAAVKNTPPTYIPQESFPRAGETVTIHLIPGPQEDAFTEAGKAALFQNVYEVSPQSDRMGYRLQGEPLEAAGQGNSITDGVVFGSVQIPPSGMPIVMMADRQTTGGYPKIATVITDDLPLLAQCPPGTKIRFAQITVEEAQRRLRERAQACSQICIPLESENEKQYVIRVNNREYLVQVKRR